MKAGQFTFYICHQVMITQINLDDVCNLPGVGYHQIKDSPYRLILQANYHQMGD